jgi:hypothetical protein
MRDEMNPLDDGWWAGGSGRTSCLGLWKERRLPGFVWYCRPGSVAHPRFVFEPLDGFTSGDAVGVFFRTFSAALASRAAFRFRAARSNVCLLFAMLTPLIES